MQGPKFLSVSLQLGTQRAYQTWKVQIGSSYTTPVLAAVIRAVQGEYQVDAQE